MDHEEKIIEAENKEGERDINWENTNNSTKNNKKFQDAESKPDKKDKDQTIEKQNIYKLLKLTCHDSN